MLGNGCGVLQYHQFYDTINYIYIILPRTYVGSYSGEKGDYFFHKPCILALAKSVETFIMVSISDMPTIKYWKHFGSIMYKSK